MSPMIYYSTISTRHEDLLKEADKERLIKIALTGQPTLSDRIQSKIGQMLIQTRRKLHLSKDSAAENYF